MKKIKFLFFTLLFCFSVPVKADTAFENDDTVLCSFLKENVPENASPIESSLENEYRKTSSKPIDFYFFKRSEKTKSFQDLYAANVLTYQEKSDRSLLYQTVFDFQNITQVRTAKEDFIRLETDPLMYLFELEKAELWTRNSTEEPWTLERKITTPGNPDFYLPYSQFSSDKKYVSLSFDAAWGADDTIHILDTLDKFNVKVTFFMTGGWVNEYPDMVKEIYSRGHDLGNHSQNHKKMSELNTTEQKQELQSVTDKVKELTGYDMFLFRPPYGDYNSTLINTAYSLNYYPIQWSVDSLDWKDYGVDNIIKTVTTHKALDNGAIILMHNGAKYTAQALESVITNLQNQGYTLVPISELIIRNNFHMDANGMQVAD